MHFFYVDETGCTGAALNTPQQPIFVIGGIGVRDEGWRKTTSDVRAIIEDFFDGNVPEGFELHAHDLMNGAEFFEGYSRESRNALVDTILDVVVDRRHGIHFVGIDKTKLAREVQGGEHHLIDAAIPYLLGFNYLVSYVEKLTRETLGKSARGMIILDVKDAYQDDIDALTHYRRFETVKARQLKRLVEFSYPIDSLRHPMIQVSDLIIFLIRKFLEMDSGYRPGWSEEAKRFYAECYAKIIERVKWKGIVDVAGREETGVQQLLAAVQSTHTPQWRRKYLHD